MALCPLRWKLLISSCALMLILSSLVGAEVPGINAQRREFFEQKVRPLLVQHCYECHSEQAEKLHANLYLDNGSDILAGGDSGPAVVPGNLDESLLISAVRYESFEMPPRGKLSPAEIKTLERWVTEGAYWPDSKVTRGKPDEFDWMSRKKSHWAWQSLRQTVPPSTKAKRWPRGDVDRFILSRLEAAGLQPAVPADKAVLIRRLYFDLIGLPPTAAEISAFINDENPLAYERLVDDLLSSKQFGEKWARHWLDLVRYGETCGHEFDYPLPDAYQYRDYVIRALNEDVPYDQFVVEHLAGDLLENPRRNPETGVNESIIGTGFWFLGEAVHSPTDVRADEADRVDNQIDVMCKTFLGLTVGCARCHDHKFDPIPTADYYSLAGFLQSSRRQRAMLDPHQKIEKSARRLEKLAAQVDQVLSNVKPNDARPQLLEAYLQAVLEIREQPDRFAAVCQEHNLQAKVMQRLIDRLESDVVNQPTHPLFVWRNLVEATDGNADYATRCGELSEKLTAIQAKAETSEAEIQWFSEFADEDFSDWYVTGEAFGAGPTQAGQAARDWTVPEFAPPGIVDSGRLGRRLQGVLRSPTFVLQHQQIHYRMCSDQARIRLIVDGYVMDQFNALLFADNTLETVDTKGQWKWVTQSRDLGHYLGHRAHIEIIDHNDGFAAVDRIGFSDQGPPVDPPHALNLQLLERNPSSQRQLATAYQAELDAVLRRLSAGDLSGADLELINCLLEIGVLQVDDQQLTELRSKRKGIEQPIPVPMFVMAMEDGDGEDERLHIRGSHRNLGEAVPRRMLLAIAGEEQPAIANGSGRRLLAERFVDPVNPFVSRVQVNRVWHHLFGRGIVPSVDDFGVMGQSPSHPRLLDWLAGDFIANGWSVKHLIRQIVLSNTYQMSSLHEGDDKVQIVDPDNRLLHKAPLRRLQAESIRDALLSISGRLDPKLYGPSVSVYLSPFMEGRGRPQSGPLDGDGRRSIYIRIQRNFLAPMMLTFDMPSPFNTMGRRSSSNVPSQSLIMMNDPFVWQQAERWAKRLLEQQSADVSSRITEAFENGIGRPPSSAQRSRLQQFVEQQAETYQSSVHDLRVWTDVCHAIMNLKEFIYLN
ncbi:MAG: DUF1553 domain-containing protein [Planctomycetaceae bacterium]|nr:DUF1553 domain-containing protein [Planctomycetaceae bacterium]